MKKYILLGCFVMFAFANISFADFTPSKWPYQKIIPPPYMGEGTNTSVDVYTKAHLGDEVSAEYGYRDLRVIDREGHEVPYVLNQPEWGMRYEEHATTIKNLVTTSDRKTVFVVDVGRSGETINRLHIETSAQNFHRHVSLFVSDTFLPNDSDKWEKSPTDNIIFRITEPQTGVRAQYTDVATYYVVRYVKVVIDGGEEGPILPTVVQAFFQKESNPTGTSVNPKKETVKEVPEKKTTEVYTELKVPTPVFGISIPVTDTSYSRTAVVQGKIHESDEWKTIGTGVLSDSHQEAITFSPTVVRYLRTVIFNGDDSPLHVAIDDMNNSHSYVSVPLTILIFKTHLRKEYALGESDYTLYFGNKDAVKPQYDFERTIPRHLLSELDTNAQLVYPVMPNQAYIPLTSQAPFSDRYPWLLSTTLVIGVLIIGGIIFRTVWSKM